MKIVAIVDDVYGQQDPPVHVPATDVVTLSVKRMTGEDGTVILSLTGDLDLTAEHADELMRDLAKWLSLFRYQSEVRPVSGNLREARGYYADLRRWADAQGRSGEYTLKTAKGSQKKSYYHGKQLKQDYAAYLAGTLQLRAS